MKVMFLDESGDHRLKKILDSYPIFVLGGVVVERSYLRQVIDPSIRQLKRKYWARDDVILHTVDMRNNAGDFAFLTDAPRRAEFYDEINDTLLALDFTVISVVVRKHEYLEQHGSNAVDLYHYAFGLLIERFCDELQHDPDGGFVCAERRGDELDRELLAAWRMRDGDFGECLVPESTIEDRIVGLDIRHKKPNLNGMQIADLVITPPGRHVLGSPEKRDQIRWPVVEAKLLRKNGSYEDAGLVIRP